jgi:carboxylesterase
MIKGFSCDQNDNDYMFLSGQTNAPLFLFIHGYGSTPDDLIPLASYINSHGYNCALLLLRGHGENSDDLIGLNYLDWLNQARAFYTQYSKQFDEIYLVGFSLGSTLSLQLATEENVAGIVAISTFLEPPDMTEKLLQVLRFVGIKSFSRILQVTHKKTKNEIKYYKKLPVEETYNLISQVSKIIPCLSNIECPIIFFHSIDDLVSDYWTVANLADDLASRGAHLVTFRCLRHFLHFDMPLPSIFKVVSEFFWPSKIDDCKKDSQSMKDAWLHASEELRHWSGIIFQIIVGFFSIFGTLLYFSLPDVLNQKSGAPYYLLSYSILISFFLILLSLYFFYLNRVNVFLKHHIEPYLSCTSWTAFRTSRFLSGKESENMTKRVSFTVIGLPLIISISTLTYALIEYHDRFFVFKDQNILLIVSIVVATFLLFIAIDLLQLLSRYTKRELYKIKASKHQIGNIQEALQLLYLSVSPGIVVQPRDKGCSTTK